MSGHALTVVHLHADLVPNKIAKTSAGGFHHNGSGAAHQNAHQTTTGASSQYKSLAFPALQHLLGGLADTLLPGSVLWRSKTRGVLLTMAALLSRRTVSIVHFQSSDSDAGSPLAQMRATVSNESASPNADQGHAWPAPCKVIERQANPSMSIKPTQA